MIADINATIAAIIVQNKMISRIDKVCPTLRFILRSYKI